LYQEVSRHHCQLDIDLPHVRARDLGSRNGTFLNGRLIGKRPDSDVSGVSDVAFPQHELSDGDTLGLGALTFRIRIEQTRPA
jgi:pSer/pThr/pTyr-binding forkhead associated (FHA) protein